MNHQLQNVSLFVSLQLPFNITSIQEEVSINKTKKVICLVIIWKI